MPFAAPRRGHNEARGETGSTEYTEATERKRSEREDLCEIHSSLAITPATEWVAVLILILILIPVPVQIKITSKIKRGVLPV